MESRLRNNRIHTHRFVPRKSCSGFQGQGQKGLHGVWKNLLRINTAPTATSYSHSRRFTNEPRVKIYCRTSARSVLRFPIRKPIKNTELKSLPKTGCTTSPTNHRCGQHINVGKPRERPTACLYELNDLSGTNCSNTITESLLFSSSLCFNPKETPV